MTMTRTDHRTDQHGRIVLKDGKGLTIGGAYVPPPAPLGSQAERIQRVLLDSSSNDSVIGGWMPTSPRVERRIRSAGKRRKPQPLLRRLWRALVKYLAAPSPFNH